MSLAALNFQELIASVGRWMQLPGDVCYPELWGHWLSGAIALNPVSILEDVSVLVKELFPRKHLKSRAVSN